MLETRHTIFALKIVIPFFIAVLSFFVLSSCIPEREFVKSSIESIDNSKSTVEKFAGGTMAAAVAISALPGDFGSPLSNSLADMEKYYVFIFMVLFVEKLVLTEGIVISFRFLIPVSCALFIAFILFNKTMLKTFAIKLMILALSLVLVIPISTHFAEKAGAEYLEYVDQTIADTEAGADKINEVASTGEEDKTIFDKLSSAFSTSIKGINDLVDYFKNEINRCMNSIAIMIVITFVLPLIVLFFFKWLLGLLFNIDFSSSNFEKHLHHKRHGEIEERFTREDRHVE